MVNRGALVAKIVARPKAFNICSRYQGIIFLLALDGGDVLCGWQVRLH